MHRIYRVRGYKKSRGRRLRQRMLSGLWRLNPRTWPSKAVAVSGLFAVLVISFVVISPRSVDGGLHDLYGTVRSHLPHRVSGKPLGLAVGDTLFWKNDKQLQQEFAGFNKLGTPWVRVDVSWADIQPNGPRHYNWAGLDRIVRTANEYNIQVLGTIAYTPAWASLPACSPNPVCEPADDNQFAAFASKVVKRYEPLGVHAWEIWNEPNLAGFWLPAPDPLDYTHLLQASYLAIKKADPSATVVSGGLGPLDGFKSSINQASFLSRIYGLGAEPYFDAVGFHPYSFPALPTYTARWNSWSMMNDLPGSIRSIMATNGDSSKKIWITEYGAPTGGPGAVATLGNPNFGVHPDHVSGALQAAMASAAIAQYQRYPWIGALFWYSYRDLGTSTKTNENFFGLQTKNGVPKPAYSVIQQATKHIPR